MPATAGKRWVLWHPRRGAKERAYSDHPALACRATYLLLRAWATEARSHGADAGRAGRGRLSRHGAAPAPALRALFGCGGCSRWNNDESRLSTRDGEPRQSNVIVRFYGHRRSKPRNKRRKANSGSALFSKQYAMNLAERKRTFTKGMLTSFSLRYTLHCKVKRP
jgi:hypothetical protein